MCGLAWFCLALSCLVWFCLVLFCFAVSCLTVLSCSVSSHVPPRKSDQEMQRCTSFLCKRPRAAQARFIPKWLAPQLQCVTSLRCLCPVLAIQWALSAVREDTFFQKGHRRSNCAEHPLPCLHMDCQLNTAVVSWRSSEFRDLCRSDRTGRSTCDDGKHSFSQSSSVCYLRFCEAQFLGRIPSSESVRHDCGRASIGSARTCCP